LEKEFKELNNKLTLTLSDCNAKDELVKKQTKIAQDAVAGNIRACLCVFDYCLPCNVGHENNLITTYE
jgi:hypothetical protein